MLVYKFLHSGNPKYFEPFLIPRHSAYNTRQSQSDGIFLEVPQRQVGKVTVNAVNIKKPEKVLIANWFYKVTFLMWSALQTHLPLSGQIEVIPLWKSMPTLNFQFLPVFSTVLTPAMSLVYEY